MEKIMTKQQHSKEIFNTVNKSAAAVSVESTRPQLESPLTGSDVGSSPQSHGTPTRGSLEWLQTKREWWKSSKGQKLVEYPVSEGNEIEKAQQALDVLSAVQTGKLDPSTLHPETNTDTIGARKSSCKKDLESSIPKNPHRDRLIAFYEKYNPSKLSTVDDTLQKYCGQEAELFRKLEAKYVKDPYLPATGTGPKCFMEFSTGGRVIFELFQDKAPFATENFRALCTGEKGASYKDCIVHRIVPNFCIQAGDYTKADGTGGRSIYPKNSPANPKTDMWGNFEDEAPFLRHDSAGLLSMANNGPNRNSSQFFITLRPLPHLNGKHVVFGRVVQGLDVVEKLSRLETNLKTQRPVELLQIVNCGEIGSNDTNISTELSEGPDTLSGNLQTASHGLSFSSSISPTNISTDLSDSDYRFKQEANCSREDKSENEKFRLDQRVQLDLDASSKKGNELCDQINACLRLLDNKGTACDQFLPQKLVREVEKCRPQLSTIKSQKKNDLVFIRQASYSMPARAKVPDLHRPERTIATFLLEDPLGLTFMDIVKGKEKFLLKRKPEQHNGSIKLESSRFRSPKKLTEKLFISRGFSSTNHEYYECDPLVIPLFMFAKHAET